MPSIDPARAREYFTAKMSFTTGPAELSKWMKEKHDEVQVVDVRAREDFAEEHVPSSINLPEGEWSNALAHGLTRDKTIVVLCYSQVCHLAARAAVVLAEQGFPVMELEGGFDAWKKHDLPTERSSDDHPSPVDRARALLTETREAQTNAKPEPKADEAKTDEAKADDAKAGEAADEATADTKRAEPNAEGPKPQEPTAEADRDASPKPDDTDDAVDAASEESTEEAAAESGPAESARRRRSAGRTPAGP